MPRAQRNGASVNPRSLWQLLSLIPLTLCAGLASAAETVTWRFESYPALEAAMMSGENMYTDQQPKYVLTRFVLQGSDADTWTEAFDVMNTMRRKEPKTPRKWLERLQKEPTPECAGRWSLTAETPESLTLERVTTGCPGQGEETALRRVLYGKDNVFVLTATVKGRMDDEARRTWHAVLVSATVVNM